MNELDPRLRELYVQLKENRPQSVVEQPRRGVIFFLLDNLAQRLRNQKHADLQREVTDEQLRSQISEIISNQPGRYPLTEIAFRPTPPFDHAGFTYSFERAIEEDKFTIDLWADNNWGILVQGHPSGYPPEIEIVEAKVEPNQEELEEDHDLPLYTSIDRILHLPEGFRIPVGPLHFESDSLPRSKEELEADKERAVKIAKAAGIKVNKEILGVADKMIDRRKYPDRYFYWQPVLPDIPTKIAIDFGPIDPINMGLTLEGAPVFNNTIVIPEEDY